jgi:hypothetical protein
MDATNIAHVLDALSLWIKQSKIPVLMQLTLHWDLMVRSQNLSMVLRDRNPYPLVLIHASCVCGLVFRLFVWISAFYLLSRNSTLEDFFVVWFGLFLDSIEGGGELRASHLLSSYSTTWATLPALLALVIFERGVALGMGWSGQWSPYLCFLLYLEW